jgi:hypothetical protein
MRVRSFRHASLAVLLLGSLLGAGCGGRTLGHVEGRVLVDGKPLQNIQVTFVPDIRENTFGPNSSAVTDEEGRYELICEEADRSPGAVIGVHRVTLVDLDAIKSAPLRQPPADENARRAGKAKNLPRTANARSSSNPKERAKRRFPAQYTDLARTPLQKQVQSGNQTIDLELTDAAQAGNR